MANYGVLKVPGAKLCYKVRGQGPVLLVLQGGGGNADASDGMAANLDSVFTTISYDRRGLLSSPLDDPRQSLSIEQHAEDALALTEKLAGGPVYLLGSSLGALIGLEFTARWPERVRKLVAHEPLATRLLSPEWQARYTAMRAEILDAALREGPRAALRRLLSGMGIDREDREVDAEPPASTREQSRHTGFLLTREARATDRYELRLDALRPLADKIIPAYGTSSLEFYPAQCAIGLGAALGCAALEFPGGHTGYVLRPRAFAERLIDVLGVTTGRSFFRFSTALGSDAFVRTK